MPVVNVSEMDQALVASLLRTIDANEQNNDSDAGFAGDAGHEKRREYLSNILERCDESREALRHLAVGVEYT